MLGGTALQGKFNGYKFCVTFAREANIPAEMSVDKLQDVWKARLQALAFEIRAKLTLLEELMTRACRSACACPSSTGSCRLQILTVRSENVQESLAQNCLSQRS